MELFFIKQKIEVLLLLSYTGFCNYLQQFFVYVYRFMHITQTKCNAQFENSSICVWDVAVQFYVCFRGD